jgi:hypothetical protein
VHSAVRAGWQCRADLPDQPEDRVADGAGGRPQRVGVDRVGHGGAHDRVGVGLADHAVLGLGAS